MQTESMANQIQGDPTQNAAYELYLDERKQLIDAARESARTFDKAVLTFGSVAFGSRLDS